MPLIMSEPECLVYLVDGLKKAAGGSHTLAHYQQNPNWLKIRDLLESLIEKCQIMASTKSMPRQEVIQKLDERMTHIPKDSNGN